MIELVKLSVKNIFRKGFRTLLTMLGISIGVASVVLISTIGSAGTTAVNAELDSLGLNGVSVSACDGHTIENADVQTVASVAGVTSAVPVLTGDAVLSAFGETRQAMLWGIEYGSEQAISIEILYGRGFTRSDIELLENVCLLDENTALNLFGNKNAVNREVSVLLNGVYENYEVIGITKTGSSILQSLMGSIVPDFAYIPISTMQSAAGVKTIDRIAVKTDSDTDIDTVSDAILSAFYAEKGEKDTVEIENIAVQREKLSGLLTIVTAVLSVIGAVSLLVSGLGIMTVMLVSVSERTKEIGIKKAIGADFKKILFEFLVEALTISLLGSIIGCIIGVGTAIIGGHLFSVPVDIQLNAVTTAVGSAVLTGVVFGIYPAYKAAKLKPVDALRQD